MSQPLDSVWVAVTHNENGFGISAHETRELAITDLFREVKDRWHEDCEGAEMPEEPEEALRQYSNLAYEDWIYELEEVPIQRKSNG